MRAILERNISENVQVDTLITVAGENHHHLFNVVRLKVGEKVLILNGKGLKVTTHLESVNKKNADLRVKSIDREICQSWLEIALFLPKKEAYELIIKNCVEMGIKRLIPVKSEYSQKNHVEKTRIEKIIESAVIQSNNAFFLEVDQETSFESLIEKTKNYDQVFIFSTQGQSTPTIRIQSKNLMLIGPEGGFSPEEEERLSQLSNVVFLKLETPILRSPTAVNVAFGYLMGLKDAQG